ncbi:hypothetical protein M9434_005724 [Picochlorum sp. BPE23]|nr:hypothetical protein M9434_005724 [Picochlorum sp. BPE23]
MTREDELIGELQREKHLRQLDNQERSKLKHARDELALRVLELEEQVGRLVEQDTTDRANGGDASTSTHDHDRNGDGEEEDEMSALQADVDILLSEVEQERRITAELEKMVRAKDKTIATLEKKLASSEDKIARLKGKNKKVEEEFEYEEMIEELKKKVSVLTQSQTQLIESLDASADELDRMSTENKALCDAVERLKDSCDAWEKQVQENIALSCRLKDLLEEGSQWIVPKGADGVSIPRITKSHRTTSEEEVGILREEYNNVLVHYKANQQTAHV